MHAGIAVPAMIIINHTNKSPTAKHANAPPRTHKPPEGRLNIKLIPVIKSATATATSTTPTIKNDRNSANNVIITPAAIPKNAPRSPIHTGEVSTARITISAIMPPDIFFFPEDDCPYCPFCVLPCPYAVFCELF